MRKYRDTKLVTTEKKRNYLVSEPNYHTTKFFTEHLLAREMKKKNKETETLMNKAGYSEFLRLELNQILIHEFQYDYIKPMYGKYKIVIYRYRQFHCINKNK